MNNETTITAVYPVVNGNGANFITTNLAFATKEKHPHARIAIIDFDFSNPNLGAALTEDEVHGIDNLIDKIHGGILDKTLFIENMIELREGVELLRGSKMGHFKNFIMQDHLEMILDMASDIYDYIFVSCNASHLDTGTPIALLKANRLVVVGRHNHINEDRTKHTATLIEELYGKELVGVVYNYYAGQLKADVSSSFAKYETVGLVPFDPESIDNLNLMKKQIVTNRKTKEKKATYEKILGKLSI